MTHTNHRAPTLVDLRTKGWRDRPTVRVAALGLAVAAAFVPACSLPRPPRISTAEAVQAACLALQRGEVSRANDLLVRARARDPNHGLVRLWCAEVATMLSQDDEAVLDLEAALHGDDHGSFTVAELHGKLGDLLFRMGRYGEARSHLIAGQVGAQGAARQAWAHLATKLPFVRRAPDLDSTELNLLEGPLPVLVCSIGETDVPFALDTRATFTTLTNSLAAQLDVSSIVPAGQALDGTGRPLPISMGVLHDLSLVNVEIGRLPVMVVGDTALALRDALGGAVAPPHALLGQDVLRRFRVTLDPKRRTVVLQNRRGLEDRDAVRCLSVEGNLLVPVQINGRELWFVLDTGASASSLTPAGISELPGGDRSARETLRRVYGPGGTQLSVRMVPGLTLQISAVIFRGVDLHVVDRVESSVFPVHGVLGSDLILRCQTTLDGGRIKLNLLEPQ